jgi:hypothetical protein
MFRKLFSRIPYKGLLALLAPRRLACLEEPRTLLSPTLERLTDRLNAPVQGTGADGQNRGGGAGHALPPLWLIALSG